MFARVVEESPITLLKYWEPPPQLPSVCPQYCRGVRDFGNEYGLLSALNHLSRVKPCASFKIYAVAFGRMAAVLVLGQPCKSILTGT
jgi:hypothetical protein